MQVQETPITHDVCCMDSHSYNGEETSNANIHKSISTRSEMTTPYSTSSEGITPNSTTTPRQRSVTRSHGRAHTSGVNSARTNLLQRLRAQRHCDEAEANDDVNTDENDDEDAFDKEEEGIDTCTATDVIVRENVKALHCDPHREMDMGTTATTTNHTSLVTLPQMDSKVSEEVVVGLGEDEHTEWESTAGTSSTTICHSASITNTSTTHAMSMATSFMSDFHVDCWTPETQAETKESLSTTTTLTVDNTPCAAGEVDRLNNYSVQNVDCCENEEKESHTTHNSPTTSHSLTCVRLPIKTCPAEQPESCRTITFAGSSDEESDETVTCALTRQCTTLCLAINENDSAEDEHRDAEEDENEDDGISATTRRSVMSTVAGTHVKAAEHSQRSYNTASSSTNSFTTTTAEEEEEEEHQHIAADANLKHAMPVLTTVPSCDDLEADFGFIEPHPPCQDKQQQHTTATTTHSLCSCEECCACVRCCCGQEEEEEEDEDKVNSFHMKDGRNSSIASPYSTSYLSHSQGHTVTHYEEDNNNREGTTSYGFHNIHTHHHRHDESDEEAECDIVQQHTMQTLNAEYSHTHEPSLTRTMSHNVNSPLHNDDEDNDDDGDVEEENIVEEEEEGEEVDEATWRAMSPMAQLRHALRHCPRQEHPFLDMRRQAMLYENHRARQHNLYCLRMSHECTTSAADLLVASKVLVNYGHRLHLQRCRMHNAMVALERRRRVGQLQGAEGNCNDSQTECEEEYQCMKENGEVNGLYKTCRSGEVEHIDDAAINKDNTSSESAQAAFDVTLNTYITPHPLHTETGGYCDSNGGEYCEEDGEVTKSAAALKDIDAIHRQWLTLAQAMEADLELDTHHLVQRRLSCMCIFNPDSDERRYTDNEETRERRLARQQATLMALRRQAEAGGSPYFLQ